VFTRATWVRFPVRSFFYFYSYIYGFREIFIFMLPLAQIHPPLPTLVPDMCMALKKANSLLFGNFLFEFFISIKNFVKNESWKVPKFFGHNRVAPYFHHFFKFKHTFRRLSNNKPLMFQVIKKNFKIFQVVSKLFVIQVFRWLYFLIFIILF